MTPLPEDAWALIEGRRWAAVVFAVGFAALVFAGLFAEVLPWTAAYLGARFVVLC